MKRRKPGESGSSRVYNAGVRPTNKLSYTVPSPSEKVLRTKGLCPVRLGAVQRPAAEGQPRTDGPSAPQAAARGPRLAPTPPSACSQGDTAGGKPALATRHPERGLGEGGPSAAATALHLFPGGAGWRPGEPATR